MWTAQFMTYTNPDSIVTSGGAGTMGFGLPAAIGTEDIHPLDEVFSAKSSLVNRPIPDAEVTL